MATRTLVVRPPLTPKSVFWCFNDDVERCSTRCCSDFWELKNGHFRGFPGPDKVSGPGKSAQNRFFDVFRRQRCNSPRLMCLHHKICSCTTNFTLSTQRGRVARASKKAIFWPLFRPLKTPKNSPFFGCHFMTFFVPACCVVPSLAPPFVFQTRSRHKSCENNLLS